MKHEERELEQQANALTMRLFNGEISARETKAELVKLGAHPAHADEMIGITLGEDDVCDHGSDLPSRE